MGTLDEVMAIGMGNKNQLFISILGTFQSKCDVQSNSNNQNCEKCLHDAEIFLTFSLKTLENEWIFYFINILYGKKDCKEIIQFD